MMSTTTTAPSQLNIKDGKLIDDDRSSKRGELIHQLFELKVMKKCRMIETEGDLLKATRKFEEIRQDITSEMDEVAEAAADQVTELYQNHLGVSYAIINTEQWIHLNELIKGAKGRADVVILTPDTVHIIDLKTGSYPVEIDSPQMKAYAAGLALKYPGHRIQSTILQGTIKTDELAPVDVIEWASEEGERQRIKQLNEMSDPLAAKIYQLVHEVNQLDPEDITGDILLALHSMQSAKTKVFKMANVEAEVNGTEYDHFKYDSQSRTEYDPNILEWLASKGQDSSTIASVSSVTKKDYEAIIPEHLKQEAIEEGLVKEGKAPKSLKKK